MYRPYCSANFHLFDFFQRRYSPVPTDKWADSRFHWSQGIPPKIVDNPSLRGNFPLLLPRKFHFSVPMPKNHLPFFGSLPTGAGSQRRRPVRGLRTLQYVQLCQSSQHPVHYFLFGAVSEKRNQVGYCGKSHSTSTSEYSIKAFLLCYSRNL